MYLFRQPGNEFGNQQLKRIQKMCKYLDSEYHASKWTVVTEGIIREIKTPGNKSKCHYNISKPVRYSQRGANRGVHSNQCLKLENRKALNKRAIIASEGSRKIVAANPK